MRFSLALVNMAARQTSKPSDVVVAETQRADRIEACKTYVEQTKLLVTLASAFLVAPAAFLALDPAKLKISSGAATLIVFFEIAFIVSVVCGYVVLGTIAGAQDDGSFNVYRGATRFWAILQFLAYLGGLAGVVLVFAALIPRTP
jgi:hypothetical protein